MLACGLIGSPRIRIAVRIRGLLYIQVSFIPCTYHCPTGASSIHTSSVLQGCPELATIECV